MRHLAIALAAFAVMTGFTSKPSPNKEFKVLNCTMQRSFGGVFGSGTSTIFTVELKALRSFEFRSDSGFAEGRADKIIIVGDTSTKAIKKLKKGQKIKLMIPIRTPGMAGGNNEQTVIPGSPASTAPDKLTGRLILRYKAGGTKYITLVINDIKDLAPILGQ